MDRSLRACRLAALLFCAASGVAAFRGCWRNFSRSEPAGATADSLRWQIDLRTAQDCELRLLPGIGPARAAAIRLARERHGNFQRWEDLEEVEGLGPYRIEAIRNGPVLPLD